jgi:hypothetical protein
MRAWLGRQLSWLVVEPLPGCAPERNPVDTLWPNLKGVELANLAGDTLEDVIAAAERGIKRIRHTHHLAHSFARHCGLSLWCAVLASPAGLIPGGVAGQGRCAGQTAQRRGQLGWVLLLCLACLGVGQVGQASKEPESVSRRPGGGGRRWR